MSKDKLTRSAHNDFTPNWGRRGKLKGEFQAPPEEHQFQEEKAGVSRFQKAAAGFALAAVTATGGYFALGRGEASVEQPKQDTHTSASANPGEKNEEVKNNSFSLQAEKYKTQPESIVSDFEAAYNEAANTGYSKEAFSDPIRSEMDLATYSAKLNEPFDKKFADEMLSDDWETKPELVRFYDTFVSIHNVTTSSALRTPPVADGGLDPGDKEHYQRFVDMEAAPGGVKVEEDGNIVATVDITGRDNRDQNNVEERITGIDPNGESGQWTLVFEEAADGTERLADYIPPSGQ